MPRPPSVPRDDDGFVNVSVKAALIRKVDTFVTQNDDGYSNRAEVVNAAIREFLERRQPLLPPKKKG